MKKMNKFTRSISKFFKRWKPDLRFSHEAISEDLRKVGVYAVSLSLVASVVSDDKIGPGESLTIWLIGAITWFIGLSLARTRRKKE